MLCTCSDSRRGRQQLCCVQVHTAEGGGGWGNSYAVYSHVQTAEGGWATIVLRTCSNSGGVGWGGQQLCCVHVQCSDSRWRDNSYAVYMFRQQKGVGGGATVML